MQEWLKKNVRNIIDVPAQSSDINSIEFCWNFLKRRIQSQLPKNLDNLKKIIENEWKKITPLECQKLIKHINKVLTKIKNNKGFY